MKTSSLFLSFVLLLTLSFLTSCHQGLFEPKELIRGTARTGKPEWYSTKEAPFPCKYNNLADASKKYPVNSRVYKPGQSIELVWPRNNHHGGFIAVSLVPYSLSGTKSAVESPKSVIMYACAENSCRGSSKYNRFNGPSICSQQQGGNCVTCSLTVPIPRHVPTGTYTIQWRLFGHFDSSGVPNRSLMDYATCLDLKIENPNPSPPPPCPAMVGNNCEHFKGVTDINQMLNGERETGNRKTPSSFVDRGLPARVQQCKANPPKVDPKPQPPQNKPQPQSQPKPEAKPTAKPQPEAKPTAKPQPPPPEKAPTSLADEAEVAEKISTLTKQLQSLVTQFNAVEETLSLRSSINKLSNQVQTLTDKFNKIQVAVVKDDNKP